jgi:hypothetical protein
VPIVRRAKRVAMADDQVACWLQQVTLTSAPLGLLAASCSRDLGRRVSAAELRAAAGSRFSANDGRVSCAPAKHALLFRSLARGTPDPWPALSMAARLRADERGLSAWGMRALAAAAAAARARSGAIARRALFRFRAWHEKAALRELFLHLVLRARVPADVAALVLLAVRPGSVRRGRRKTT